jgi:inactive STAND
MNWEEFLIVQAYRKDLKPASRDFFIRLFMDEIALDLPVKDLATKYCVEFKTCTGHRTAIFGAFGDCDGQQNNGKLRPLYQWLKHEHEQQERQAQSRSSIPSSPAEQLHQLLQRLNYSDQEQIFRQSINPSAAAFLVRIDDLAMQQWLVWRLVEQLRQQLGEDEKPRCLMVKASPLWAAQPELLWEWLAGELECDSNSKDDVLEAVVASCRHRSQVFVVHEFAVLKSEMRQMLLDEFWQPLVALLESQANLGWGKCRLLLTEDCDYESEYPIVKALAPWKTVSAEQDLRPWLENRQVLDLLGKPPDELAQEWLREAPPGKPKTVVKQLGQAIGLADGIDEMKPYWQLAA